MVVMSKSNPTKDIDYVGAQVAERLRDEGYRIIAYGARRLKHLRRVPHQYIEKPSLQQLNELYMRATIMIKATRYDARSTSPIEAMTKGTVTARAIIEGDDDLEHEINCLKVGYNVRDLHAAALRLLRDADLRNRLAKNCADHIEVNCDWDKTMFEINEIITNSK